MMAFLFIVCRSKFFYFVKNTIMSKEILKIIDKFKNKKIAIVGDLMLDHYIWGRVSRVSPEAPVPVVDVEKENFQFGGAANVAANIKSLGGIPIIFGVVGDDAKGEMLINLFKKNGVLVDGIIKDKSRPTTIKTRVIAHQQHVVRIDSEKNNPISNEIENKLLKIFEKILPKVNGVILEDYNKGVLTKKIIEQTIKLSNSKNKIITVDPKFKNFIKYKNVTLFKPNTKELESAFGFSLNSKEELAKIINELQNKIKAKNILLTRGDKGMSLFQNGNHVLHLPTKALQVADVSGAGDTVIAAVTMGLVADAKVEIAIVIANHAAGIVCQEVGAVPIKISDLRKSFQTT